MSWLRLAVDLLMFGVSAVAWLGRVRRPSVDGLLALWLPALALVALFVLAGLSSPHAHRASHGGIALADGGCLAAATLSWAGMDRAQRVQSYYRVPLVVYGLGIGLFFMGEAIAVTILNW